MIGRGSPVNENRLGSRNQRTSSTAYEELDFNLKKPIDLEVVDS